MQLCKCEKWSDVTNNVISFRMCWFHNRLIWETGLSATVVLFCLSWGNQSCLLTSSCTHQLIMFSFITPSPHPTTLSVTIHHCCIFSLQAQNTFISQIFARFPRTASQIRILMIFLLIDLILTSSFPPLIVLLCVIYRNLSDYPSAWRTFSIFMAYLIVLYC